MRRYLPVLLLACFIVVNVIAWSYYLAGYAGDKSEEKRKGITVYTAISVEPVLVLAQEYERTAKVPVHVVPLSEAELLAKLQAEADAPHGDIVLGGTALLNNVGRFGYLAEYTSEALDMIPERFYDADNLWTGIWYDPIVWAVNQDYWSRQAAPPTRWTDLTRAAPVPVADKEKPAATVSEKDKIATAAAVGDEGSNGLKREEDLESATPTTAFLNIVAPGEQPGTAAPVAPGKEEAGIRLALTDFLAADAASNLLYTFVAVNGEKSTLAYLKKMHPLVVQYAKFLATPVRMAGLGEADIAIAVQSEAFRYMRNGFPIKIVCPEEGTAALITAAGLVKNAPDSEAAKLFLEWLTQDAAHATLQKSGYFYIPTNPESAAYRDIADKNLRLLEVKKELSPEQRRKILDQWVQSVRLGLK